MINVFFHDGAENSENTNAKNPNFDLLDYLFSVLNTLTDLNDTVSGYFLKVVLSIYRKKTKEVFFIFFEKSNFMKLIEYVYSREDLMKKFLKFLNLRSMSEIYLNFLAVECTKYDEKNEDFKVIFIKKRKKVYLVTKNWKNERFVYNFDRFRERRRFFLFGLKFIEKLIEG